MSPTSQETESPLIRTAASAAGVDSSGGNAQSFAETYWEQIGSTCRWGRYLSALEEREILAAAAEFEPGLVLEVGCDGGRWCTLLAERGWNIVGTDVNPTALAVARRWVPRGLFVEAGSDELPAAAGSVRLLLAIQVPAVAHTDWFVREAGRVLEPGGALVFSINNRSSWRALKHNAPGEYPESYTSFRRRLSKRGLFVDRARGAAWFPFHRTSDSALVGRAVGIEETLRLSALPQLSPLVVGTAHRPPVRRPALS